MALTQTEFHELVDRHAHALFRVAYRLVGNRHEAEDLVQETFRSAWKSRDGFDRERGERAWLAAILRRRVVDHWRKHAARLQRPSGEMAEEVFAPAIDPLAGEYTDEMQSALQSLAPEIRESLLLVVVGELTHQEAADLLGVPLGTVLSRVSRARTKLREVLASTRSGTSSFESHR